MFQRWVRQSNQLLLQEKVKLEKGTQYLQDQQMEQEMKAQEHSQDQRGLQQLPPPLVAPDQKENKINILGRFPEKKKKGKVSGKSNATRSLEQEQL